MYGKEQGRLLWCHGTNAEFAQTLESVHNPDWGEGVRAGKGWELAAKDEVRCEMPSVQVRLGEERVEEVLQEAGCRAGSSSDEHGSVGTQLLSSPRNSIIL